MLWIEKTVRVRCQNGSCRRLRRQFDRRKTAVPVIQMDDVGRRADPLEQGQGRMVKKGEPLIVLGIAVDRIAMKKRRSVDQKGR